MTFASRLPAHLAPNALAAAVADLRARGVPLLDLTESNPTRAGFTYPEDTILRALSDPRVLQYRPEPFGLPVAREAVARLHGVDADRVVITTSTSEAYAWLFKLLCDPGDEILVPRPSYPLFEMLARLEAVHTRPYPLHYVHGWFLDLPALQAAITPRTRAIVVVNPNNPTGSYLKQEEHATLAALCEAHELPIICDEVFSDYTIEAHDPNRITTLVNSAGPLTFSLNGLSKLAGMPQMKLGWMIVSGPFIDRRAALERLEMIADTYLSVSAPVQCAAPVLLEAARDVQREILARVRANYQWLTARVAASPASLLRTEGGWSATLRMPRTQTEEDRVLEAARERGVLVQPGYFYDFESEAFLVLSLLTSSEVFREGVGRVVEE